jgi:hypothetical protein
MLVGRCGGVKVGGEGALPHRKAWKTGIPRDRGADRRVSLSAGSDQGSSVSVATVAAATASGLNGNGTVPPVRHGSIWSL